jgi:hypothetical protein
LELHWALANLQRTVILAGAPQLGGGVTERLAELVASLPAVTTEILAAMLERPANEWEPHAWRDNARTMVEVALDSGDPAAVENCRLIVDYYVRLDELDFRKLLNSSA